MALILAVNPLGTQSGTLPRLPRELRRHELIGADSSAAAIAPAQFAFEAGASSGASEPQEAPHRRHTPVQPDEIDEAPELEAEPEPAGPSAFARAGTALLESRESMLAWLPHAAALAAAAGLVWALVV